MVLAIDKRYSITEYLELETQAEFKSEFWDGEIIPIAGATANHNKIALNFCRLFPLTIDDQDYEVFMSDMRLWIPDHNRYTYPDVMIVAGKPNFTDEKQTAITNPSVIVEILSDSTQGYDRASKFKFYRSLPSFREYILVDQSSYSIDQYAKQSDNRWILTEYLKAEAVLKLESVSFKISLQDLYKRVVFEKDTTRQ